MSDNDNKSTSLENLDWGLGKVVWAKTNMKDPDDLRWSSLAQHSIDTALVAGKVWDEFLPDAVKNRISEGFNGDKDVARRTVMFLSGCHDVGKATPAFERQVYGATGDARLEDLERHGMVIPQSLGDGKLRHEISGYWAMVEWMTSQGVSKNLAEQLSIPIGGHHGTFWGDHVSIGSAYSLYSDRHKNGKLIKVCYGGDAWDMARKNVISAVSKAILDRKDVSAWRHCSVDLDVQTLIAGIITMADWMSSDSWWNRFPLTVEGLVPQSREESRVTNAWRQFSLTTPYQWGDCALSQDFSFRFGLPSGASPNDLQTAVLDAANNVSGQGGMLIIEAPMGGGKTEAALLAAEILGRRSGCGGLAFALPTQATADGVLGRVAGWAKRSSTDPKSLRLMHGNAWLNKEYGDIRDGEMYDEESESGLVVTSWFDRRQTGLLANFVICTIDQILMMALQSKHFDLRHLGLAGKVVVIDEVHAADDYMLVYLERALEWLGSYKSPVIVLSATLPQERRNSLAMAYSRGLNGTAGQSKSIVKPISNKDEFSDIYPLITKVDEKSSELIPIGMSSDRVMDVDVTHGGLEDLKTFLSDGGNALVMRDTVGRAQSTYEQLKNDPFFQDWELRLIHARFVSTDRRAKEDELRTSYGKDATVHNGMRPRRSITVATQVVEQSLDVDFDILMTDVCPMDLLLQRIGRMHRHDTHDASRPTVLQQPKVIIDGWSSKDGKITMDTGSQMIYGASKLLRTIALTGFGKEGKIHIPNDISPLVQKAYSSDTPINIPSDVSAQFMEQLRKADATSVEEAEDQRRRASVFRLRSPYQMDGVTGGSGLAALGIKELGKYDILWGANDRGDILHSEEELRAQVRDSGIGVGCILMIKSRDGNARFLDSLRNGELSQRWPEIPLWGLDDEDLTKDIMSQAIGLPPALSNDKMMKPTLDWMEDHCYVEGWQDNPVLKNEFVLFLDEYGRCRMSIPFKKGVEVFDLSYSPTLGLRCVKVKDPK